jgi:hypothetical protein
MCVTVDGFVVGQIIKATTVNFAVAKYSQAMANVLENHILQTSRIQAWLAPNSEWDADDLVGYTVAAIPKDNSIDFCIFGDAPIVGNLNINYFWS